MLNQLKDMSVRTCKLYYVIVKQRGDYQVICNLLTPNSMNAPCHSAPVQIKVLSFSKNVATVAAQCYFKTVLIISSRLVL